MNGWQERLEIVIQEQVGPTARHIDKAGVFPQLSVQRLGTAGILGLASSVDVGGGGAGLRGVAGAVEAIAKECGSTAMVLTMHYAATVVIEAHGPEDVRRAIAGGRHLTTLAFSERGSRESLFGHRYRQRRLKATALS